MQTCQITLTTTADGRENTVTQKGKMRLTPTPIHLSYVENGASVCMEIEQSTVRVVRKGDYDLDLLLLDGKKGEGSIGLGGSNGGIETFTHKLSLSVKENAFLLTLRYDLLIGKEVQHVKLRILAKGETV